MGDWISFFDSDHSIYVNARHREAHARITGDGILAYVQPGDRVLDFGCGEAAYAERIGERAGKLLLCEAAPKLREALAARVRGDSKINVLSPDETAKLPEASLDLVVMHSVAQYLSPDEADNLFRLFHRLLRPGGRLVVGDVIQPGTPVYKDALALLAFGARDGFFLAAVAGLVRTALSDYWRLRKASGLTRYEEDAMVNKLAAAGFEAARATRNIGHLQTRMTMIAQRR